MFDTKAPQMAAPQAPAPPPSPPMFGRDAYGQGAKKRNPSQGFAGTLLGNLSAPGAGGTTAGKTLLGQ